MYETIIYEKKEHIAYITLNRPSALNARNSQMTRELSSAYGEVRDDPDVWVLIISGAGERAFCAGRDLKEAAAAEETSIVESRRARALTPGDTYVLDNLDKPVIAAIHGFCLGGGLELALACDIRIASEDLAIGQTEVGLIGGLPGSGGIQRLSRLVGRGFASEMVLLAGRIDAQEAYRIGLVNKVVPRAELMPTAEKMAQTIASYSPVAVRYAKEAIRKGLEMTLEQGLALDKTLSALIGTTEDSRSREGPKAFAEKRKPVWKGR